MTVACDIRVVVGYNRIAFEDIEEDSHHGIYSKKREEGPMRIYPAH
jgi:hypothetical protein